jgi:hypothetical protein
MGRVGEQSPGGASMKCQTRVVPRFAQVAEGDGLNAALCDFLGGLTGGVLGGPSCAGLFDTIDWLVSVLTVLPLVGGFLAVLATLFMSVF